jgi:hypothetical protein
MQKHKLLELQKLIEERIGSLKEEVEIGTNVKLNPIYIVDRRDEIRISPMDYKNHPINTKPGY